MVVGTDSVMKRCRACLVTEGVLFPAEKRSRSDSMDTHYGSEQDLDVYDWFDCEEEGVCLFVEEVLFSLIDEVVNRCV